MGYLWRVFSSVMTAASVVSLPVPAVVGTAISSGRRRITCSRPSMRFSAFLGRTMRAPSALAQSMEEPPPKAISPWQPCSR